MHHLQICTLNSLEFIKHDIPVLIEKPISHSSKGVKQLLKLAKKKSVPILVGHHRRYNQIIKSAKNILNEGQIGKIRSVNSLCWFYKPDQYFKISPWRKNSGAGPILTNLIHDIDLLRFFCGEINSVQSLISRSKRGFKNEDTASVILNFKSGILGTMSVSDSIVSPWSWEMNSKENSDFPFINQNCYFIGGTKGSLSIPDLKIWSHEKKPNWLNSMKVKRFSYKKNNPFVEQINHFIRVIKKIDRPLVSGIEGYKSLKVVEAIKNSAKYNKIIKL